MYILTNSKSVKMNKDNHFHNKLFLDSINNKIYSSDQYIIKNFDIELTEEEKNLLGEHIYNFDADLLTKIRKEQYIAIVLEDNILYLTFESNRSINKYPLEKESVKVSDPYKFVNNNKLVISIPKHILKELANKEENEKENILLCFDTDKLTPESIRTYGIYNNGTKGMFVYKVKDLKLDDYFDFPCKTE